MSICSACSRLEGHGVGVGGGEAFAYSGIETRQEQKPEQQKD
jgi:hypothetical protein